MSSDGSSVVLCQTSIGDYRQAFLDVVVARLGHRFLAFAGSRHFDPTVETRIELGDSLRPLGNHFIVGRRFLWQSGAWAAAQDAGVAVLEFNARILSVWLLLVWRRLRNRPTLLWGHAWPRSGRSSRSIPLRRLMQRLASGVIVYTQTQERELSEGHPQERAFVAPNAIYPAELMWPAEPSSAPDSFLYVGRLVPSKKPDVLLEAFLRVCQELPSGIRLVIVGDGPMFGSMRARAAECPGGAVEMLGHVKDVEALRDLYRHAIAAVSPGAVGLSITQSLGFGVPMLIARDEPHGPEIEAARDGWNAVLYAPSSAEALAGLLLQTARDGSQAWPTRGEISAICRGGYSAEAMADGFLQAVDAVAP